MAMDLETLEREMRGKAAFRAAADSPEGRALAARLDDKALRDAARRGDGAALGDILQRVLSTPEGKALAEKVQKAVEKP